MKKILVVFFILLFSSNAFASVTAEEAYDIARMEIFPMDVINENVRWSIIKNETPVNFDNWPQKPYDLVTVANKVKGKEYWAVEFLIGEGLTYLFIVDSNNGKILASYPTHEEIIKYFYRRKGFISMDEAIAIADKEMKKRNINVKQTALKIRMERREIGIKHTGPNFLSRSMISNICQNYSTIQQLRKLYDYLPGEQTKPAWEIDYWLREINRHTIILIDAITGKLVNP